jgi:hypothetical protein
MRSMLLRLSISLAVCLTAAHAAELKTDYPRSHAALEQKYLRVWTFQQPPPNGGGGNQNQIAPDSQVKWPQQCMVPGAGMYQPLTNTCAPPGTAGNPAPPAGCVQSNQGGVFNCDAQFMLNTQTHRVDIGDAADLLPVIDVRSRQFTQAPYNCPYVADQTAAQDSTCNAKAMLAYAASQAIVTGLTPTVYFPAGKYKISDVLRASGPLMIKGDGPDATMIVQTNPTANLFTIVYAPPVPATACLYSYCGFTLENMKLSGSGHLTTGTLIEYQTTFWKQRNITLVNHGGRGIVTNNSERGNSENLYIYDVRWPVVLAYNSNEVKFSNSRIQGGETDNGTWSYDINANPATGAYPAPNSAVCANYPAWQPNTPYPTGTIICDGANHLQRAKFSGYINSATNVYVIGVSGATAPTFASAADATTLDNGGGNADNTIGNTGTSPGITWQNEVLRYPLSPNYHAMVTVAGLVNLDWSASSLKITQHAAGISFVSGGENYKVSTTYAECFVNHCTNPGIEIDAQIDKFVLTSGLASGALSAPVTNGQWAPYYYNDPADVQTVTSGSAQTITIFPPDFDRTSNAASSCGGGLLKNQLETALAKGIAGDGKLYLINRGQAGTTAPANYAWCNNAVAAWIPGPAHGGVELNNVHTQATAIATSTGYTSTCGDQNYNSMCKDILGGPVFDGMIFPYQGSTGAAASLYGKTIKLANVSTFFGGDESEGHGMVGCAWNCAIEVDVPGGQVSANSNQFFPLQYFIYNGTPYTAIYTPTSAPYVDFNAPASNFHVNTINQTVFATVDTFNVLGGGNSTPVSYFNNSYCIADLQPIASRNWLQHCFFGGTKGNFGYGESIRVFNGTTMTNAFAMTQTNPGLSNWLATFTFTGNVNITGNLTGSKIGTNNGYQQISAASYQALYTDRGILATPSANAVNILLPDCTQPFYGATNGLGYQLTVQNNSASATFPLTVTTTGYYIVQGSTPTVITIPPSSSRTFTCAAVSGPNVRWAVASDYGSVTQPVVPTFVAKSARLGANGCNLATPASYDSCTDTVTFSPAFADTSYTPTCNGMNAVGSGSVALTLQVVSWTAAAVTVKTQTMSTGTGQHFSDIVCNGVHN